jgi:hypothetical protein
MKMLIRAVHSVAAILVFALTTCLPVHAQTRIEDRFANVNGIRLHYLIAGKGDPVILLHGYAQNSHMWRPLIPQLALIVHSLLNGTRQIHSEQFELRA